MESKFWIFSEIPKTFSSFQLCNLKLNSTKFWYVIQILDIYSCAKIGICGVNSFSIIGESPFSEISVFSVFFSEKWSNIIEFYIFVITVTRQIWKNNILQNWDRFQIWDRDPKKLKGVPLTVQNHMKFKRL